MASSTRQVTALHERLYRLVRHIPAGRVASYKLMGALLGVHPRVIGRLLAQSPGMPAVPCHRVVHASGKIGGYAFGSWAEKKRLLLAEGVHMRGELVTPASFLTREELLDLVKEDT